MFIEVELVLAIVLFLIMRVRWIILRMIVYMGSVGLHVLMLVVLDNWLMIMQVIVLRFLL